MSVLSGVAEYLYFSDVLPNEAICLGLIFCPFQDVSPIIEMTILEGG